MSFDRLLLLSDGYMFTVGLTAFCTYIKALRHLQLNPHIAELAATLRISGKGIMLYAFMVLIIMSGYIAIGNTIFGTTNIRFHTWGERYKVTLFHAIYSWS